MWFLITLAFRNLFRNKFRTALSSVVVMVGVAIQIFGWGLVDGGDENVLRAASSTMTADVLIRPSAYPKDNLSWPLAESLVPPPSLLDAAAASGTLAPRLLFNARLVAGTEASRVLVVGYDPELDFKVFPRTHWAIDGTWPAEGQQQVVVGRALARLLDLAVGREIILEARSFQGALNAYTYTVSGVVHTDNSMFDNIGMWMPLALADTLVLTEGRRTHLALDVHDGDVAAVAVALDTAGFDAVTVREETADMLAVGDIRRRAVSFLVLIIMVIAATGIANTVVMAAYERVREVGTLMAFGMPRRGILQLFLIEGAVMGITAGGVGAVLGSAVNLYFSENGIDLSRQVGVAGSSMSMGSVLYTTFAWTPVLASVFFAIAVAVIASIYPARYAAGLVPADAVRAE